jgi:hypothetical protein
MAKIENWWTAREKKSFFPSFFVSNDVTAKTVKEKINTTYRRYRIAFKSFAIIENSLD